MDKQIHYFCEGYTSDGYVEYYWENLKYVNTIAIIDHLPLGTLTKVCEYSKELANNSLEILHSGLNHEIVLGVIFDNKFAVVEYEIFELISTNYLSDLRNTKKKVPTIIKLDPILPFLLTPHETIEINNLTNQFNFEIEESRKSLARAKEVHDRWESLYLREIDFEKVDKYIEFCCDKVCEIIARTNDKEKTYEKNRFLGAGTYKGSYDFIENLTEGCKKIYVQGYPGTAKSTLIKRVIEQVKACNFVECIERYHCGFDPQSLDMVIFRNSKLAIFDCTAPHQYIPDKHDEVFNVYEYATTCDVNKMYKEEISSIQKEYKRCTNESTTHLKAAETCQREIDQIMFQGIFSTTILAEKLTKVISTHL